MSTNSNKTYVGIDLGTSNSVVSFFKNASFEQVEFRGNKTIPSALYFQNKNEVIFGGKALKKGVTDPAHLLTAFKRDLGTDKRYEFEFEKDSENIVKKHYIVDTNIFIASPDILKSFNENDMVHLSMTVQTELSFRATKDETKIAAQIALENIEKALDSENISLDESDLDLLPEDLTVNSANDDNDHRVLSIAVKVKNENENSKIFLLTNDSGLQGKAKAVGVNYLSLDSFRTAKNISSQDTNKDTLVLTPKKASAMFLKYLKEESEKYIGHEVDKAVITIPANFTQAQAELTREAGVAAGFTEIRIQKEPVAAGLSYALDREDDKNILVYDFGGGTFDATILQVGSSNLEVLGVNGDPKLGGDDITNIVIELINDYLEDEYDLSMFDFDESGLSESDFKSNSAMIKKNAEEAKIDLSSYESTTIAIPNLIHSNASAISMEFELTRATFEDEISGIRKQSLDVVKELISNSNLEAKDIDIIVMAGGSSNIPSIYNSIKDTLGKEPSINKDTALVISEGAVIEAMQLWDESNVVQERIIYNDNSLFDFGIGLTNYVFDPLISAGTQLPFRVEKIYATEKDDQETLQIRAFQRKQGHKNAMKTHDKGIDFVDEILIYSLPPSKVGDLKIKVIFELTKDDILAMAVSIADKEGNEIDSKDVKIKKVSEEY